MYMTKVPCRGLLIDMDGVLVDSTAAIARVWTRWAARHNLDPAYVIHFAHGRMSPDSVRELLPDASAEIHREEALWMERGEIEDVADVVALPGARALLAAVPASQRSVVTSSTRPLAEVRLQAAGLWDLVSHIVTASDVHRGKPDPEPYQKGAALLQLPPADCVVIEDAPSGTRAAKTAGARVLAVRTTSEDAPLFAAGADWIANDCASLRCSDSNPGRELLIEFPDNEIPSLPKIS
jgi:sugar-phosphatase